MTPLTQHTATSCVGYHQIDLPAQAKIVDAQYRFDDLDITNPVQTSQDDFERAILQREAALRKLVLESENIPALFKVVHRHETNTDTFAYYDRMRDALQVETHNWKNHYAYTVKSKVYNFKDYGEPFPPEVTNTLVDKEVARHTAFVHKASVLGDNEQPPAQGFCAGRLVLAGSASQGYSAQTVIRITGNQELMLTFDLRYLAKGAKPEPLFDNLDESGLNAPNITISRKNKTEVNGMEGHELGGQAVDEKGQLLDRHYIWDMPGVPGALDKPNIKLTLTNELEVPTGIRPVGSDHEVMDHKPPTMPEEDVLALWDKVLYSIRSRPTGPAPTAAAAPLPPSVSPAPQPPKPWWKFWG